MHHIRSVRVVAPATARMFPHLPVTVANSRKATR